MPLTQPEQQLVSAAVREFSFRLTGRPLADVQEGALKITLLEVLLDAGCTVYEAAAMPGNRFWEIRNQTGVVTATTTATFPPTPGYKPDVRVRQGTDDVVLLELKCRPAFGSKAQANYQYVRNDLNALAAAQCNALIFVADGQGYDTMSANTEFSQLCPPRDSIGNMGTVSTYQALNWNNLVYGALATRMPSGFGDRDRVIVTWF